MAAIERAVSWRKAARRVAATLLLWLLAGTAQAQDPADPIALKGEWKVAYVDQALGVVTGLATIGAGETHASVTLVNPLTGAEHRLTSRSIRRQGDEVTIELEGHSPGLWTEDGLGYPDEAVALRRGATQLTIRGAGNETSIRVRAPPETDVDRVTLRLRLDAAGNLSGSWEYRVAPFLERDETGRGRNGLVEESEDGVWLARGAETWSRPRMVLYGAVPVENQMAVTRFSDATAAVDYPYPFRRDDGLEGSENRLLFVFGRDLPTEPGDRIDLAAETAGVDYGLRALMSDLSGAGPVNPVLPAQVRDAKAKLKAALPETARALVDDLDWMMVGARVGEDAAPGYHSFTLNDVPVAWLLQFGDNTAAVRIVRWHRPPIHPQDAGSVPWESTAYLFEGEYVWVEVEAANALPVAEIPILLGRNGKPARDDSGRLLLAHRTAGNPRLYRTGPIYLQRGIPPGAFRLAKPGRSHQIGAAAEDLLFAMVARPGLFSVEPQAAQALIYRTPADDRLRGRWQDYMAAAAACHSIAAFSADTSAIDDLTNFTLSTGTSDFPIPGWFHTKAKLGHHAAMLALRHQFLEMMEGSRSFFAGMTGDATIQAFRDHIEAKVRAGLSPFAHLTVKDRQGNPVSFLRSYDDWNLSRSDVLVSSDERRWAIAATREALASYRQKMADVIAEAKAIDPCDVEGLLELTGSGFEPVVALTRTKFMRRTTPAAVRAGRGFWEPNYRARAWLGNVGLLAREVRIKEHLSKAALQEAMMAVGVSSAIVGVVALPAAIIPSVGARLGSMVSAVFAANTLWDVADVGVAVYGTIADKLEGDARYAFALATAEVLGIHRVEAAKAQRRSWLSALTEIGIGTAASVAGLASDVPDAFRAYQKLRRLALAARGPDVLEGYARGGGFTPPPRVSRAADEASTATLIEPVPDSLLQSEIRTGDPYRPIDQDVVATAPVREEPNAGSGGAPERVPEGFRDRGPPGPGLADGSADADFEMANKHLAEGSLTGSAITIRAADGRTRTVRVGPLLGAGSFNAVYAIAGESKVLRIALTRANSPAAQFDMAGQRIAQDLKESLADDVEILDAEVYPSAAADDRRVNERNLAVVERFEGPRASRMVKANPDGGFTPGQAIAFDKAMRAFNRRGYALLDAHPANYAFRQVGDDEWRFVLLDPGGLVPAKGLAPWRARRIQGLIDNPPQDLLDAVGPSPDSAIYYVAMSDLLVKRYLDALVDLERLGLQSWSGIEFRPQGAQTFPKARSLASDPSLEPEDAAAAYDALRQEYRPHGTARFDMPDFDDPIASGAPPPPIADVRQLPRADRDALGAALVDAMKRAATGAYSFQIQSAALDRLEREAGLDGGAGAEQALARLSEPARRVVTPLMHRPEIRRMLETAASEIDRALTRDGEWGAIARRLLAYEPDIEDIADFLARVEAAAALPQPVGLDYFEAAGKGGRLDDALESRGWNSRIEEVGRQPRRVVRFFDADGNAGFVVVGYEAADASLLFSLSSRKIPGSSRAVSEVVDGLQHPGTGAELATVDFFTMQALNDLGIGYGGRGGSPVSRVRLVAAPDLQTAGRLAWAARTYHPGGGVAALAEAGELGKALRDSPAVQEAERRLAALGYTVGAVAAVPRDEGGVLTLGALAAVHPGGAAEGLRLIERYGLAPQDTVPFVQDLVLEVGPAQ